MFKDRYQAGVLLAQKLRKYSYSRALILAIPRGGVPVAHAIADELGNPLDIIVTRKLGAPNQSELAIGAVGPEGVCVLDSELITYMSVDSKYIEAEAKRKTDEIVMRIKKFRGDRPPLKLNDKTIILADDGIATGATVEAAIKYLKKKKAKKIILAVPVAPTEAVNKFRKMVNKIVVLESPGHFRSVGQFYEHFPQLTDDEVISLLKD